MDSQVTIIEYHTLRQLEERLESPFVEVTLNGLPKKIKFGKRWDFYIAAADVSFMIGEFNTLLKEDLIEQIAGKRTYSDWRSRFPEYHYRITEKGQAVLEHPEKYVERPNYKIEGGFNLPPY